MIRLLLFIVLLYTKIKYIVEKIYINIQNSRFWWYSESVSHMHVSLTHSLSHGRTMVYRKEMGCVTIHSLNKSLSVSQFVSFDTARNSGTCLSTHVCSSVPVLRAQRVHAMVDGDYTDESADPQSAEYSLNFLWLDKNLAVSVDQVFGRGHRSPITEYFFWPREDAWERLKSALEEKDWIGQQDKVALLNTCTEVINYWQDEERPSVQDAIAKYPNCSFQG